VRRLLAKLRLHLLPLGEVGRGLLCIFVLLLLPAITHGQIITTFAGIGVNGYSGEGVPATTAGIADPEGGFFDKHGNYYFSDGLNSLRIRRIDTAGIIITVAGNGATGAGVDGIAATATSFIYPNTVILDTTGNIYIVDGGNNKVRKVDAITGIISTIVGTGAGTFGGDNGPAIAAKLYNPQDACLDKRGNLYIADFWNNRVRKVNTSGIITTIAGNGLFSGPTIGDGGPATAAQVVSPWGIATDDTGNIYIAEMSSSTLSNRIRKVDTFGTITTVAGNGSYTYTGDGIPATAASINPIKVTLDDSGQIFIADENNYRIFKVDHAGIIHLVAGNGTGGFLGDGGPATAAEFNYPAGVAFDPCGNLYIPEPGNHRIRKIILNTMCSPSLNTRPTPKSPAISIFPNPATEQITITANTNIKNITITDLLGQTVLTHPFSSATAEINITGLKPGIYFVAITEEDNNKVISKIVKQ
jgi:hypothetical protein